MTTRTIFDAKLFITIAHCLVGLMCTRPKWTRYTPWIHKQAMDWTAPNARAHTKTQILAIYLTWAPWMICTFRSCKIQTIHFKQYWPTQDAAWMTCIHWVSIEYPSAIGYPNLLVLTIDDNIEDAIASIFVPGVFLHSRTFSQLQHCRKSIALFVATHLILR